MVCSSLNGCPWVRSSPTSSRGLRLNGFVPPSPRSGYARMNAGYMVFVLTPPVCAAPTRQGCPLRSLASFHFALASVSASCGCVRSSPAAFRSVSHPPPLISLRPRCAGPVRAIFFYPASAPLLPNFQWLPSCVIAPLSLSAAGVPTLITSFFVPVPPPPP